MPPSNLPEVTELEKEEAEAELDGLGDADDDLFCVGVVGLFADNLQKNI